MFGYVKPDLPYLYLKDDKLFKSLYCGVCKSIGKTCGETARMTLTFDIAFLSAIAHNILGKDVEIKNKRCILHPIKPRPIAARDELTDMLSAVNVLLAYYKVEDDIIDSKKGRLKKVFVSRGFKRAREKYSNIDKIIRESYAQLRTYEKNNDEVIDRVSEPFAQMLVEVSQIVLGEKSNKATENLFYFLGKWIYLIDALDDYDKDIKKKCYNPFYFAYKCSTAKELLINFGRDIAFTFTDILQNIAKNLDQIEFYFNKDLICNILLRGLPAKTDEITKRILKNE